MTHDDQRLRRRKRSLLLLATGAALLALGGLAGATLIESPAERAAASRTLGTPLSAPVEEREVTDTLVLRGTVEATDAYEVTPTVTGEPAPIVTEVVEPAGSGLAPGDVVVEVAGRPLAVLTGTTPMYRDLAPGTIGDDVAQLQAALHDLGISSGGDASGRFGAATEDAVERFYDRLGYDAPIAGDAEALERAGDELDAARDTLAETQSSGSATGAAEDAVRAAEREHADLAAVTGPMVPRAELVFLPAFPGTVAALDATVGDTVEAPLLTLAAGELRVDGALNPADRPLVEEGMRVTIAGTGYEGTGRTGAVGRDADGAHDGTPGDTGTRDTGRTDDPSAAAGTPGAARTGPPSVTLPVVPDEPLPPALIGEDVRLTVEAARSDGAVLAVPEAAVTAGAGGDTWVIRLDGEDEGERRRIAVEVGVAGDGMVEVAPADGGLHPDDRVLLGR